MKKVIFLLVTVILLVACKGEVTPTPTPVVPPQQYLLIGISWVEYHNNGESCRIDISDAPFEKIIFISPSHCSLLQMPSTIYYYQFESSGDLFYSEHGEVFHLQVWSVNSEGVYKYMPPKK